MKPWNERPEEIAFLFNPSFCGQIIMRSLTKYTASVTTGVPFALSFLILPIVLHKETSNKIPSRSRIKMHKWLQNNQEVKVDFAKRTTNLLPITKESILFLASHGYIKISSDLKIVSNKQSLPRYQDDIEILNIFHKSEIVGKWFAESGSPGTIFTMWGVKP